MFTAIGKFVAFMFRATQYETVIADIFGLGTFIRNCTQSTIRKIGEIQFYPAMKLQQELRYNIKYPTKLPEPCQRQELTLAKIAQVCSLSEEVAHKILAYICKAIVSIINLSIHPLHLFIH